ncbi:tRNA (adenosine(37)-N6)-threonylcarbamoyltransferase complex transferase subunit TsaD [Terriglobus albidus]|uniref:tRNA N6-adenosine threonylcarbamoyltransferase n=1 Tax=Terriglobus albidus TaxID=1592106 RepID=A0A5B9E5E0_9BACT|nr:tRNA (adenosine(37)-N6)-threonylcarbamoyltransferase complex transferase subunit TsaD [Terriglobus albidus]QEE27218.1 tRNA (adenosine(37)-N6)-threonylcarbamoyltransferase complex transferase subunit TsaD [Terriglobus albidus]
MASGLILGIESSCDETAAAVVRSGSAVLSNVVASQIATHALYGGVVPELASREHLTNIVPVVRTAVAEAGITLDDLDAVAVTEGPGLAGALLVGITYAKALAYGLGKPLIAVNHLEGHIHAVLMEAKETLSLTPGAPVLALVVSGGHTHLYLAEERGGLWSYRNVGRTIDDAAGEAYDKSAKLLGLGYPGGPLMDFLADHGDPNAVEFKLGGIKPKLHRDGASRGGEFDFSFSGIKTAVLRYTELHHMRERAAARHNALMQVEGNRREAALALCDRETLDLIASFQKAVVGYLVKQTMRAAEEFGAGSIVVSGGVAANRALRERMSAEAAARHLQIAFPSLALATDNAAMIAAAAWPKFAAGLFASDELNATPQLRLG